MYRRYSYIPNKVIPSTIFTIALLLYFIKVSDHITPKMDKSLNNLDHITPKMEKLLNNVQKCLFVINKKSSPIMPPLLIQIHEDGWLILLLHIRLLVIFVICPFVGMYWIWVLNSGRP